jgi:hypothetical protein
LYIKAKLHTVLLIRMFSDKKLDIQKTLDAFTIALWP